MSVDRIERENEINNKLNLILCQAILEQVCIQSL